MTEDVRKLLKQIKTDDVLIPVKATDVVWNKHFKDHIMESYDEWLASGVHHYTEVGNVKPALR